jgi:hypothetical protein
MGGGVQRRPRLFGRCPQTLVSRPQSHSLIEKNRGQQMGIRVADPHAENGVAINHHHDLVVRCDECFALSHQECYHATAFPKTAECKLSDHGRMAEETIVLNNPTQLGIGMPEMINPD